MAATLAVGFALLDGRRSAEAPSVTPLAAAPVPKQSAIDAEARDPVGPLHVLLIVADSLRADMPWTGYDRPIAPWLTAFAKQSVTYTRAYSISSTTARSMGPLLVGRYPSEMERNDLFFSRYYPSNEFVSERLSAAGHHTAALLTHTYFTRGATRMDQGFADYVVIPGKRESTPDEAKKACSGLRPKRAAEK